MLYIQQIDFWNAVRDLTLYHILVTLPQKYVQLSTSKEHYLIINIHFFYYLREYLKLFKLLNSFQKNV